MPEKRLLPEGYSYHPEGYVWHVLPTEGFSNLPETINIRGESFFKKSEFHVTVINARALAGEIVRNEESDSVQEIEKNLQLLLAEYLKEHPITFLKFTGDLRLAVSSDRKSIAARCEMQGMEGYFARVQETYGLETEPQPAHVSIYTLTGMAIGIDTLEQMESYEKIDIPDLQQLLQHHD